MVCSSESGEADPVIQFDSKPRYPVIYIPTEAPEQDNDAKNSKIPNRLLYVANRLVVVVGYQSHQSHLEIASPLSTEFPEQDNWTKNSEIPDLLLRVANRLVVVVVD